MPPTLQVQSTQREMFIDVTRKVAQIVQDSGIAHGVCVLFCPHTTAGLTINENTDPDVPRDCLMALRRLIPQAGWPETGEPFRHFEHNADAHLKASLFGPSLTIPIIDGELALGRWQAIYLAEFDGPRNRELKYTLIPATPATLTQ